MIELLDEIPRMQGRKGKVRVQMVTIYLVKENGMGYCVRGGVSDLGMCQRMSIILVIMEIM